MKQWSNEVFGSNLRRYMERSGKSQRQLAEIVGVSTATFSDWINGKKYPRIDKIEILANYFGILKSDLIEDKTEDSEKPVIADGLTEDQRALVEFARTLPEDKAALALRLLQSIVESE